MNTNWSTYTVPAKLIVLLATLALAACHKSPPTSTPTPGNASAASTQAPAEAPAAEDEDEDEDDEDSDEKAALESADTVDEAVDIVLAGALKKFKKACAAGDAKACVEVKCTFDRLEATTEEFRECAIARQWRQNDNWVQTGQSGSAGDLSISIMCNVKLDYGRMGEINPEAVINARYGKIELEGIQGKTFASIEEAGDEACRYAVERHDKR